MTDQPLLLPPDDQPEPDAVAPKSPRLALFPWLYGLGFLLLVVAIVYLWQYPVIPAETVDNASSIHAVQQSLTDIQTRVTQLEQRPTADLAKITARIDSLDGRIVDQTQLASRLDVVSGRVASLANRDQTSLDAARQQLDALTTRVAAIEANAGNLDALTKRLNRIARLQEASFALASGRAIGDVPNAPEALLRYAHAAPPTEAHLRLRFPLDARAAMAAKQTDDNDAPFVDRVWERAQGLITVRRGDDVVVGNTSAVALGHAQASLDAGDLSGAVTAVETLRGEPARVMASWLSDATALLKARSALADMADHA